MTIDPTAGSSPPSAPAQRRDAVPQLRTSPSEWALVRTVADPLLTHDIALAQLSQTFARDGARSLLDALDDAARPALGFAGECLLRQADALAEIITNRLGLRSDDDGFETLLLGPALQTRRADPLLLAALCHELGRRAGLRSVVAGGERFCCVLTDGELALPICFGEAPHGNRLDVSSLRAYCAHELTLAVLNAIAEHAPDDRAAAATRVRDAAFGDLD